MYFFKNYSFKEIISKKIFIQRKIHSKKLTIIYSKNYSFRKKWELFIQKIIQLQKNYSTKYSFKKFENYSFKKIIHFFEKLIIAQGYPFMKRLILKQKLCPEHKRFQLVFRTEKTLNRLKSPLKYGGCFLFPVAVANHLNLSYSI